MNECTADAGVVRCDSRAAGLLILGMHRSGTSLITDVVRALGLYIGEPAHLTPPNWENPKGFFERRDMRALCDRILHAAGRDWWKVGGFSVDAVDPGLIAAAAAEFRHIRAELDMHGQWAVKEPRLCLVLPALAGELGDCATLIVVRSPVEVAKSLRTRNGFPTLVGLALWEVYTLAALRNAVSLPRRVVLHHDILRDPVAGSAALRESLLELGFSVGSAEQGASVVDVNLHRSRTGGEEEASLLSAHQRAIWHLICEGKADEVAGDISPRTRQILSDFDVDESAHRAETLLLSQRNKELNAMEQELNRMERLRGELQVEFSASELLVREREAALRSRAAEVAQLECLVTKSRANEVAAVDDAARLGRELQAVEAVVGRAGLGVPADRRPLAHRVEDLERRASALGAESKARQARVQRLRQRLSSRSDTVERVYFAGRLELFRWVHSRFAQAQYWLWDEHLFRLLPSSLRRRIEAAAVSKTPFFRTKWYRRAHMTRGVGKKQANRTPAEHFVTVGWRRGLPASPQFDTKWYLEQHPKLAARGINPLLHFIKVGALTGARPKPNVDVAAYLERNPAAIMRSVTMAEVVMSSKKGRRRKRRSRDEARKGAG